MKKIFPMSALFACEIICAQFGFNYASDYLYSQLDYDPAYYTYSVVNSATPIIIYLSSCFLFTMEKISIVTHISAIAFFLFTLMKMYICALIGNRQTI